MPRGRASNASTAESESANTPRKRVTKAKQQKTPPPPKSSDQELPQNVQYVTIRLPVLLSDDDSQVNPLRPERTPPARLEIDQRRAFNALLKGVQAAVIQKDWGDRAPIWSYPDVLKFVMSELEIARRRLMD